MGESNSSGPRDRVPSYKELQPASRIASRVKSRNRKTDTKHEVVLRQELWRRGLRFRKNVRALAGVPDIVFTKARVVVFCDGDFWHGRHWNRQREKLARGANSEYWIAKLRSNIERDQRITTALEADGWQVVRVWETDVMRDPAAAAEAIAEIVQTRHNASVPAQLSHKPSE